MGEIWYGLTKLNRSTDPDAILKAGSVCDDEGRYLVWSTELKAFQASLEMDQEWEYEVVPTEIISKAEAACLPKLGDQGRGKPMRVKATK